MKRNIGDNDSIVLVPLVAMVTFVAMFPSVIMVYVSIGTTPITVFDVAIGTNLVPFKHWYHEINGPIKTDDAILFEIISRFYICTYLWS